VGPCPVVLEEEEDIDLLERVKEGMKKGMEKRGIISSSGCLEKLAVPT
jgi:hypothetical protein